MANLQVKGMDDDLYAALGARAAMENRSISQEVVVMIRESLSRRSGDPTAATRELLELAGSWEDDRSSKQISADLRKSRRTGKRRRSDHVLD